MLLISITALLVTAIGIKLYIYIFMRNYASYKFGNKINSKGWRFLNYLGILILIKSLYIAYVDQSLLFLGVALGFSGTIFSLQPLLKDKYYKMYDSKDEKIKKHALESIADFSIVFALGLTLWFTSRAFIWFDIL